MQTEVYNHQHLIYNIQMQTQSNLENKEASSQEYNFSMTESDDNSRCLYPSLLNKSSIHTYSGINKNINQLPSIPNNTQKVNLARNNLSQFPLWLSCLKEANLSHNKIQKIPEEINQISSLLILRLNHNNITILPFLKYVRHLQICHNPIKVITTKIQSTHLQFLAFDWMSFLMHPEKQKQQKQCLKKLCYLIKGIGLQDIEQFIEFDRLFQKCLLDYKYPMSFYLHKAIFCQNQFFIHYLINYHGDLNYNSMKYLGRLILQEVLEEDFQPAIELFTLKKSNFSQKSVFLSNIMIACQFQNLNLFSFLVNGIFKRAYLIQKQQSIINNIIINFDEKQGSGEMLKKILKYSTFNKQSPMKFQLPQEYSFKQAEFIANAIIYIFSQQQIKEKFLFQKSNTGNVEEPLIHFAVANRKPKLIKILVQNNFSIFSTDSNGKKSRAIRGSIVCRKILWKQEKKIMKNCMNNDCYKKPSKIKQNIEDKPDENKWVEFIFKEQKLQTPKKIIQKENKWLNNLTSKKIQRLEGLSRQIPNHNRIVHIGSPNHRSKHQGLKNILVPNDDHTGLVLDYWMHYSTGKTQINRSASKKLFGSQEQKINPLIQYERFQDQFLNMSVRDYNYLPERKSFFASLRLCAETEDCEEQKQKEYVFHLDVEHIHKDQKQYISLIQ